MKKTRDFFGHIESITIEELKALASNRKTWGWKQEASIHNHPNGSEFFSYEQNDTRYFGMKDVNLAIHYKIKMYISYANKIKFFNSSDYMREYNSLEYKNSSSSTNKMIMDKIEIEYNR